MLMRRRRRWRSLLDEKFDQFRQTAGNGVDRYRSFAVGDFERCSILNRVLNFLQNIYCRAHCPLLVQIRRQPCKDLFFLIGHFPFLSNTCCLMVTLQFGNSDGQLYAAKRF